MDLATVIGLVAALGSLALATVLEGGELKGFVGIPAALIVFGGSLGAALVALPLGSVLKVAGVARHAVFVKAADPVKMIQLMSELARIARREGVLALEEKIGTIDDRAIKQAIQLVVDGTDPEVTDHILSTEIDALAERHELAARFFSTMGGLTPTLGVTGTVMGLVHMLKQLDDPGKMGPAIASAFLATLYGVASANLIFLPISTKLGIRSREEQYLREMVKVGIRGLQAGDSPIVLVERLNAFLSPAERAHAEKVMASGGGGGE